MHLTSRYLDFIYNIGNTLTSSKSGMFSLLSSNANLMKIRINNNSLYNLFLIKTGTSRQLSNIYESQFEDNSLEGSVINIIEGVLTIGHSSFHSNQGSGLGPLIKAYSSTIIIQNNVITGDMTPHKVYVTKSGLFYLLESSLKLSNSTIKGGKGTSAGVLYSTASTIDIIDSLLNASTTKNAALYSSSDL